MIENVIAPEMNFFDSTKRLSGVERNIEVYDTAQQQTVSAGQPAHIYISDSDLCDFRNCMLRFNFNGAPGSGGTFDALPDGGVAGLIDRVRVLIGSALVTELINFNLLYQQYLLSCGTQAYSTTKNILTGCNDNLATRTSDFSNNTKVWTLPIGEVVRFLGCVVPTGWMSNQIHIEIYFAPANFCIESDRTGTSYSIENIEFHYRKITVTDAYRSRLNSRISSGGLQIPFLNFSNYNRNMPAATTRQQNNLPWKYSRFIGFYCVNRDQNALSLAATQGKFTNYLLYNQFDNSRLKVNNIYFPADSVNGTNENLIQIYEARDIDLQKDSQLASNYPKYFTIDLAVTQFPQNLTDADEAIQGIDISTSASSLVHEIQLKSGGAPVNIQQDYFAVFFSVVSIDSSGNVIYLE